MKILITTSSINQETLEFIKDSGISVLENSFKRKVTQNELKQLLLGMDGVFAGLENYNLEILKNSDLKVISRCGSGLSNVDLDSANKLGIKVFSTPNGPTQSVAELTIGCLIGLIREIPRVNNLMHDGVWEKNTGHMLSEMNVLIIGYGKIGRKVSKIIRAIGSSIYVHDPFLDDSYNDLEIKRVDLKAGLQIADIILIHSSGDDLIIGENEFQFLKEGVYLLNAARGGLIDEKEMEKAIISGKIAGAWLDAYSEEPYNGNLSKYDQVIMTPHIGSYTIEGRRKMEMECAKNLIQGLNS